MIKLLRISRVCRLATIALLRKPRMGSGSSLLFLMPLASAKASRSFVRPRWKEAFDVACYNKARRFGGQQKIVTPDGYVFELRYINALIYLPLEYPSDSDVETLPRVYLTSPGTWNPEDENDDDSDIAWYDAVEDPDAQEEEDFYDSREGWLISDEPEPDDNKMPNSFLLSA
jgi:hypothetical protein